MNVLIVGGGGRECAITWAMKERSKSDAKIFAVMNNNNPKIAELCKDIENIKRIDETDKNNIDIIVEWAKSKKIDIAIIGLEDPLSFGIVNKFRKYDIPAVGPTRDASQIEMSKEFARNLLEENKIPGRIEYSIFDNVKDARYFIENYDKDFVVKPIGLTGGKGVKVLGEHLITKNDAINYVEEIILNKIGNYPKVLIEEKLDGEEFTLQCFVDGKHVVSMPAVQDHKRAKEGDKGPNTGGMGSYSQKDGLLPFLKRREYEEGVNIIEHVVQTMRKKGIEYKGIIYGQFMLTTDGVKVIEFNARFGDSEAMNVLPLLKTDFIDICWDIIGGNISSNKIEFEKMATVCKYIVPVGYGTKDVKEGIPIEIDYKGIDNAGALAFPAKLNDNFTTRSRSIAIVGKSDKIEDAEKIAESATQYVKDSNNIYHRTDIGKKELIEKRIKHMDKIRQKCHTYKHIYRPEIIKEKETIQIIC